jgi:hypothetical protein
MGQLGQLLGQLLGGKGGFGGMFGGGGGGGSFGGGGGGGGGTPWNNQDRNPPGNTPGNTKTTPGGTTDNNKIDCLLGGDCSKVKEKTPLQLAEEARQNCNSADECNTAQKKLDEEIKKDLEANADKNKQENCLPGTVGGCDQKSELEQAQEARQNCNSAEECKAAQQKLDQLQKKEPEDVAHDSGKLIEDNKTIVQSLECPGLAESVNKPIQTKYDSFNTVLVKSNVNNDTFILMQSSVSRGRGIDDIDRMTIGNNNCYLDKGIKKTDLKCCSKFDLKTKNCLEISKKYGKYSIYTPLSGLKSSMKITTCPGTQENTFN